MRAPSPAPAGREERAPPDREESRLLGQKKAKDRQEKRRKGDGEVGEGEEGAVQDSSRPSGSEDGQGKGGSPRQKDRRPGEEKGHGNALGDQGGDGEVVGKGIAQVPPEKRGQPAAKLLRKGKAQTVLLAQGGNGLGRDLGIEGHLGEKVPRSKVHHYKGEEDNPEQHDNHMGKTKEKGPGHGRRSLPVWATRETWGTTPPRGVGAIPERVFLTAVMASGLTRSTMGTSRVAISCQRS